MTLENYIDQVKLRIKEYLPADLNDVEVTVIPQEKNNGVIFHGISIHHSNESVSPLLYAEDYFELLEKGMGLGDTLHLMVNNYILARNEIKVQNNIDLSYDHIKSNLFLCVVNAERNQELLANIPHQKLEDLAVVYRSLFCTDGEQVGSMLINNRLLEYWNVDQGKIHEQALKNMDSLFTLEFCKLAQKIFGMMDIPIEEIPFDQNLFLLSNDQDYYGAAYLSCPDVLKEVSEKMGGDFLIIPSSVHELIIIKDMADTDIGALIETVRVVNRTELTEADFLSDNIYRYDSQKQTLSMIDGNDMELEMKMQ